MKSKQNLCALILVALLALTSVNLAAAAPADMPLPSTLSQGGYTFYTVQPGDNLYRISLRYGVSMYAIMQYNGITNANHVYVGQVLRIPTGPLNPPPAPPPPPQPQPSNAFYYTVRYGDTLAIIAARYNTTVWAIMQANGLTNPNFVYNGQVLCIPSAYIPPRPITYGWLGEYFNNERLAGAPAIVRYDAAIDFDWGLGWPNPKINADYFSVRWTRTLYLGMGTWRFTTATDDGVRLYVDNVLVIDQWQQQPCTTYTADVPLGAGNHLIRMEYFELTGVAQAHLNWQKISDTGPANCTGCSNNGAVIPTGAWFGQYYDNMNLNGDPSFTRTDAALDFDWGIHSPGGELDRNFWSARWTQQASFVSGKYRFHAVVDDGVRIFVDGKVVMDEWEDNPGYEHLADVMMKAGSHDLRVEYFQRGHEAKIKVWWEKLSS